DQFGNRFAHGLADDVPERHFDAAQHSHQRDVRPRGIAAAIDPAPERLDAEWVGPDDIAGADILDHPGHNVGSEGRGIDLTDPLNSVVGHQLQEYEVIAAEMGRRIADDEGLDLADFHNWPFVTSPCLESGAAILAQNSAYNGEIASGRTR